MKLTLARKIQGGFLILSFLMVVVSFVCYRTNGNLAAQYDAIITNEVQQALTARQMQVALKKEVQEWKDTLLRGSDPQALAKYSGNFHRQQEEVAEWASRLRNGCRDPEVQQLVEQFQRAHDQMRQAYEPALTEFAKGGGRNFSLADNHVKGIDRPPTDLVDTIVGKTNQRVELLSLQQRSSARTAGLLSAVLSLLAIATGVVVGMFLTRSLGTALRRVSGLMNQADLTKRLPVTSDDEIGALSTSVNVFLDKVKEITKGVAGSVHRLATAATELSAVSKQTAAGVSSMSARANAVAAAAEEASANTLSVASGIEQSAGSLSSVASATEQMSATVGDIAANTAKARAISEQAVSQAQTITEQMQKLGQAAQEIGQVTETITNISAQTNLLALNATIEAARAGSAGKGFAVVANEIKELARQTAEATEDIKARIAGIQNSTGTAVSDIGQITGVIKDVGDIVAGIAAAIEEQAAVTKDVAGNIAQASVGVRDANERVSQTAEVSRTIARDIAGVNSAVADIRQGGEQVQVSAAELPKLAEQLRGQVAQFRM